jgi:hypothetical protein
MLYPEPEKGGRGKKSERVDEISTVSSSGSYAKKRLQQARQVLRHNRALDLRQIPDLDFRRTAAIGEFRVGARNVDPGGPVWRLDPGWATEEIKAAGDAPNHRRRNAARRRGVTPTSGCAVNQPQSRNRIV